MDNTNIDLIRSHMDTIILRTLQNSDKYGLEILNEIKTLSDDLYTVKQPTLYSSLKRLETQGLILSCPGDDTKGANRTYYRLTDEGRAFLQADQSQWEFARTIIDKLLSDKEFDKDAEKPFEPSDYRPLTKRTKKETEEKVVVKYVEIEKPIYIDRTTGERLENYSPTDNNIETSDFDKSPPSTVAVYNNQSQQDIQNDTYVVKNEVLVKADEIEDTKTINNAISEEKSSYFENYSDNEYENQCAADIAQQNSDTYNRDDAQDYTLLDGDSQNYSNNDDWFSDDYTSNKTEITKAIDHNDYIDDKIDYVSLIQDVISEADTMNKNKELQPSNGLFSDYEGEVTMTDLEHALESKNIVLKRYQKSNTVSYYSGNFYYSNKLLRDWSWITYCTYLVFIIATYFAGKSFGLKWEYSLGFAFFGLILPVVCTFIWGSSPLRKKRNNLTLNNALLSTFILVIAFMLIILIVAFFIAHIDIQKPEEYIPALVLPCCSLVLMPISVMIYALLFKIKSYHLK